MQTFVLVFCLFTSVVARRKGYVKPDIAIPPEAYEAETNNTEREDPPTYLDQPVFFNHLSREGIGDLPSGLKQPINLMGLSMLLQQARGEDIKAPKRIPLENKKQETRKQTENKHKVFASPRDKYLENFDTESDVAKNSTIKNDKRWFDFENILNNNSRKGYIHRSQNKEKKVENSMRTEEDTRASFLEGSFNLMPKQYNVKTNLNWSSCDDYKTSLFHPKDVIGYDWIPFYAWSTRHNVNAFLHKFSYPTKKLVQKYKERYGPYLSEKIDWTEPKLLMKDDAETLLIAADRRGLYNGIRGHQLPENINMKKTQMLVPIIKLRIKIVDPYLALIFCDDNFAILMSIVGDDPVTDEDKTVESKLLKFNGKGYPITRDIAFEQLQADLERKSIIDLEESKFIRAIDDNIRAKDKTAF